MEFFLFLWRANEDTEWNLLSLSWNCSYKLYSENLIMEKKKIQAVIEIAKDGGYGVYCVKEPFTGMGHTVEEAKKDMLDGMNVLKQVCREDGLEYPSILDEDFEIVYKFDVQSFMEYYSGIITPTALGRISGINPKQIWNYMHGVSKPRKAQVDKIEAALHKLGRELMSVSF